MPRGLNLLPRVNQNRRSSMSKLLGILVAGLVAGGAYAQTSVSPTTSLNVSPSIGGSKSAATSDNTNTNANSNSNSNTVNVYGPGSNKLARQQGAGGTGGY